MGFFSKFNPFKAAKKVANTIAKPIRKVSQKFIPKELRAGLPYLSAAMPFMLPGNFAFAGMNPALSRGIMSGFGNIASQAAADPEGEDINLLSTLLAGGSGALSSTGAGQSLRDGIIKGPSGVDQFGNIPVPYTKSPGFFQGAENLGREGLATAADYLGGAREGLAGMGSNPGSVFTKEGAKALGKNIAPILTQGSGDLSKTYADKVLRDFETQEAKEQAEFDSTNKATDENRASLQMTSMRQAGIPEDTVEETLEMNGLSEYYVAPETAAYGGMMGRNDYEFGGITEAVNNAGARGLMTENNNMGGIMNGYNMGGSVLPQGMEMDYRQGGFIPMGSKERADDVPARVSKNEFVMTADAVRAAGGGSVNEGAKKMYEIMNNLEARA